MTTSIIKNNIPIASLPLQGNLQLVRELMGKNEIQIDVQVPNILLSPIGSHIEIKGKEYTVNTPPLRVEKLGDRLYNYSLMFESVLYRLYDKKLRHLGSRTFQFYGNLTRLAQLIVDNINEIDTGWTVGICDDVPEKIIDFSGHTCRTALDTIAEAFEVEWENIDKEIRFTKSVGRTTTHVFEVGRGKGLYTLSYAYQNDKNIVTRAYGYGGTLNLPEGFKGTELTLPEFYLEGNTDIYGIKEGDYVNPDIFPEVKGALSGIIAWVEDAATFKVQDTSLNFNVNDYISPQAAKLSFKSGELQGQEFEIVKFDNATKTYTLKTFVDGNNNTLPNLSQGAQVGDTYTLFDIFPPLEIELDAINRLRAATQEYVNENKVPRVLYSMQLDPLYARNNNILLNPGDKVQIVDEALGIDVLIRVTKVAYPPEFPEVLNPGDTITVEIANFIPYTLTERVISDVIDTKNEVKIIDRTNIERARRNAINLRALESSIFDTDGLFDSDKINVGVLSATLGIFGVKSQNFVLNGVYINDNYGGDPNSVNITTGKLNHLEISNPGNQSEWFLQGINLSGMIADSLYYVYAKCSKTNQEGTFAITTDKIGVEDVPGYFHFLMGVIYPVNNGYRDSEFTNGIADINGNRLKIGKIVSRDGLTWFDLDNGEFRGKFKFTSGIEIEQAFNDLADTTDSISNYLTAVLPTELSDLQNQIDGTIESFFYQYDPTPLNAPANNWNTPELKVKHGNDTFTNTNTGQSWRWLFENGEWIWKVITDTATQQALLLAGQAKDTADSKRRNFIVQPTAPYEQGDTWTQGAGGDLMRCVTSRLLPVGAYNAADWTKASKYTDDTAAQEVRDKTGIDYLPPGTVLIDPSTGKITANFIDTDLLVAGQLQTRGSNGTISIIGNTIISKNPNGNIARKQTVEAGIVKDIWYDVNGNKILELGQQGLIYVQNLPESWGAVPLAFLSANTSATDQDLRDALGSSMNVCYKQVGSLYYTGMDSSLTAYIYSAGENAEAAGNKQYEGYKTTSGSKTSNIADGWYTFANFYFGEQAASYTVQVHKIIEGKIVQSIQFDAVPLYAEQVCSFPGNPNP